MLLVFPVKTNGPLYSVEEDHLNISCMSFYQCLKESKKAPGVFVAERTAVLTVLAFPLSASSFRGVLEATQEDMRAGVFTMDRLFSLSCVASVKLQANKITCYMGNMSQEAPQKRKGRLTAR